MGRLIDADELKDIVEYMCDEDGSEEAQKWCNWFIRVIQAQENRYKMQSKPKIELAREAREAWNEMVSKGGK